MLVFKMWVYSLEKEDVETDKVLVDETRVVEGHSMASDSASRCGRLLKIQFS